MRYRIYGSIALFSFSLLAGGCGSSALVHSDASPEATVARRESRANAFPAEAGQYLGFSESSIAFLDPKIDYFMEVVGPAPQFGAGVMEVIDPQSRSFLLSDRAGVRILALGDVRGGAARRLQRPMRLVTYPLRVGRIWQDRYGRGKESVNVRHWIADRLTVRTPEGNFEAYQIERHVWRGGRRPAFYADGLGRYTYYYAPGIGPVQIGIRWPGVTTQVYQLCARHALAFARAEPPAAEAPWRGLTAGLEDLARE